MSAFTPEGLPFIPTEFAAPQSLDVTPDVHYRLFELMMHEVEVNPDLSSDQAKYHLKLSYEDPRYAAHLVERFDRPGGYKGPNAL